MPIDPCAVAGDDTGFLQPLDAFGHRRLRQSDLASELRQCDAAVGLQRFEDFHVFGVEVAVRAHGVFP